MQRVGSRRYFLGMLQAFCFKLHQNITHRQIESSIINCLVLAKIIASKNSSIASLETINHFNNHTRILSQIFTDVLHTPSSSAIVASLVAQVGALPKQIAVAFGLD